MYYLVPFLEFSSSVPVCCQLATYVLFGAVSCFLDLFLSVVSYQRMYCLVPCLEFSRSVPVLVRYQRMYCLVKFLQFSRSVPVWG